MEFGSAWVRGVCCWRVIKLGADDDFRRREARSDVWIAEVRIDGIAIGVNDGERLLAEEVLEGDADEGGCTCLLYTSPSPRDKRQSRMPSSA